MFGSKGNTIKKVWFLPRERDNPPEDALQLGDIIFRPDELDFVINAAERVEVPTALIKRYTDPDSKWERKTTKSIGGGISAAYLQAAGISLSLDHDKSLKESYEAERLETIQFSPNSAYLEECFRDADARIELAGPNAKKCLYMITGLKLAYGATKTIEELRKNGKHLQVGLDSALAGFPGINVGPKGHYTNETETKGSTGKRNFVFAFQLRKLTWDKKQQSVIGEAFVKGALYSDLQVEDKDVDVVVDAAEIGVQEVARDEFEDLEECAVDVDEDLVVLAV